ncbi:MAG TPA: hypothetical protein VKK79_15495, partial [Candidatus Lokiarchaeia archaeon]|nr:hypothetical protein [Candidatus Lokiarchaeia archaeon]
GLWDVTMEDVVSMRRGKFLVRSRSLGTMTARVIRLVPDRRIQIEFDGGVMAGASYFLYQTQGMVELTALYSIAMPALEDLIKREVRKQLTSLKIYAEMVPPPKETATLKPVQVPSEWEECFIPWPGAACV